MRAALKPPNLDRLTHVQLSPNGLHVLDSIGKPKSIHQRVHNKGFKFDKLYFLNEQHEVKDDYCFGDEALYGYPGLRLYRQVLIEEMVAMVRESGISIHYEHKFSHVISDTPSGVTFAMADGVQLTTDMLVGADGIHSTVRAHIADVEPQFGGLLAITSAIPRSALRLPRNDYPLPCTIQGKAGAFVMAPQDADGSELLIGTQRPHAALDLHGWTALRADKPRLIAMFTAGKETWSDVVQSALEATNPQKLNIWPFHTLPRLERWTSDSGRVVILGDAAHAIPPSAGQGVNQAFEDAYALALLLPEIEAVGQDRSLAFWQAWRQDRIDKVNGLTQLMNNKRLPEAQRKQVENLPNNVEDVVGWLYRPKLDAEITAWVQAQTASGPLAEKNDVEIGDAKVVGSV